MQGQLDASEPPPLYAPHVESARRRTCEAAFSYFMVMLAASWLFGPVREFFVRAGGDPLLGALSQAAATLLALTYAAGWVVRTFSVPPQLGFRLSVGVVALALFVAVDAASALLLFGSSPLDLSARMAGSEGVVAGLTLMFGLILPSLLGRSETP